MTKTITRKGRVGRGSGGDRLEAQVFAGLEKTSPAEGWEFAFAPIYWFLHLVRCQEKVRYWA